MRAAIDGDIVLYSVCFAASLDPVEFACHSVRRYLENIMHAISVSGADVYLTGSGNYRVQYGDEEFPYKGNRSTEKPYHFENLREYMIDKVGAIVVEGEEADDVMGILGYAGTHVICTLDKDLNGVPGWHYNWKNKELYMVSPEDADRFFYIQMLTGDSTDNIPGLYKRVGIKATQQIKAPIANMTDPAEMFDYVRNVYLEGYRQVGMCLDDAEEVVDKWLLKQGRQLWIRREEGELWETPIRQ